LDELKDLKVDDHNSAVVIISTRRVDRWWELTRKWKFEFDLRLFVSASLLIFTTPDFFDNVRRQH
jgi:hypothetical protein